MTTKKRSILTKMILSLIGVFALLTVATISQIAHNEREMVAHLAIEKALSKATSYFDGVNTMMLTGTTNQRGILRDKVLAQDGVIDLRLIRSDLVSKTFGPGNPEQSVQDDTDRRGLQGETLTERGHDDNGRIVTVVVPFKAQKNFRGTDCLNCHQVPEESVLGAVRISLSLAEMDREISENLWFTGSVNSVLMLAAVALITWLLHRIAVRPLTVMRDTMHLIEKDADLARRLQLPDSNDEIAQVARAFNGMLDHFGNSLRLVSGTADKLNQAAQRISEVAEKTALAANEQRNETMAVATAVNELESTAMEVRQGATSAADASVETDQTAATGAGSTRSAIEGIQNLVEDIRRAAEVVDQLDERSKSVGSVLDVIKNIAEQTNLLALNAAIEAARAGEQGRGFAVVAEEVRALATRSHDSTQEIESIVEKLQSEARQAVVTMEAAREGAEHRRDQVSNADAQLNRIVERVSHIRELNTQMAHAADEQSNVTREINRNVATISQLSERTSEDVQLTTNISRDLLGYSAELEQLVHRFKL